MLYENEENCRRMMKNETDLMNQLESLSLFGTKFVRRSIFSAKFEKNSVAPQNEENRSETENAEKEKKIENLLVRSRKFGSNLAEKNVVSRKRKKTLKKLFCRCFIVAERRAQSESR